VLLYTTVLYDLDLEHLNPVNDLSRCCGMVVPLTALLADDCFLKGYSHSIMLKLLISKLSSLWKAHESTIYQEQGYESVIVVGGTQASKSGHARGC
jgi:hypothetical protein